MKKLIVFAGLALVAVGAFGQENKVKSNYPHWTITKDVHRLQYRNVEYVPSTIETGNATAHISKGIHLINVRKPVASTGTVAMTGMPASVITKGVARMQHERERQK